MSVRRENAELWKVVLGLNNLDHPGVHSQTRGVRSIIVHPRYNRAVVDYDISVVQLDSEVRDGHTHTHTHTNTHTLSIVIVHRSVMMRSAVLFSDRGDGVRQTGVSA